MSSHLYNGIFDTCKENDIPLIIFIIIINTSIILVHTWIYFIIMKYLRENNKIEVLRWITCSILLSCIGWTEYSKF